MMIKIISGWVNCLLRSFETLSSKGLKDNKMDYVLHKLGKWDCWVVYVFWDTIFSKNKLLIQCLLPLVKSKWLPPN